MSLLETHGSDALRYWASSARLGTDAAFDEGQMKIGRRLAIKVLNASKFALTMGEEGADLILDPARVTIDIDRSELAALRTVIDQATQAFEKYDHTRALEVTETFFWTFCDDYLELVKERAYNREGLRTETEAVSARTTLALVIDAVARLLAPFLPFATEEVWSWYQTGSVHLSSWPVAEDFITEEPGQTTLMDTASAALIALRRVKSDAKVSPKTPVLSASLRVPASQLTAAKAVSKDLEAATRAESELVWISSEASDVAVENVELGEPPKRRKK